MRKFKYALLLASMLITMTAGVVDARDPKLSAERPSAATPAGPRATGENVSASASCPIEQPIYYQYCDTGWLFLGVYSGQNYYYYGRDWYTGNFSTYCGSDYWLWSAGTGTYYYGWATNNYACGF